MTEEHSVEKRTFTTEEVLPDVARMIQYYVANGYDFENIGHAFAAYCTGAILLRECGVDPFSEETLSGTEEFADIFYQTVEKADAEKNS